jgi:hypothetical protein
MESEAELGQLELPFEAEASMPEAEPESIEPEGVRADDVEAESVEDDVEAESVEVEDAAPEDVGPGNFEVTASNEELEAVRAELSRVKAELAGSVERYAEMLRTRPDVIPELVQGATVMELEASLEKAQQAFRRVVSQFGRVSAGGGVRSEGTVLPPNATPFEMLTYAVSRQSRNTR